jgi:thiamine kinase
VTCDGNAMRNFTNDTLLERAFAALPMLGPRALWRITALAGGFANRSWLLAAADRQIVLRVPVHDTRVLGVDRASERIAIEAAAHVGLAPQLIYFDVVTGLMLSEYAAGPTWSAADTHDLDNVGRLAGRLRILHAIEPPAGARRLDYAELIAQYRRRLAAQSEGQPRNSVVLDKQADRMLASLSAAELGPALGPTLCHNDVHHRNIVDGEALWLIDWEYAAVGDRLFDLASFACYHEFNAAERIHLLEAYAPRRTAALAKSLDDRCWLFNYMHLLWLELTAAGDGECQRLLVRLAR